MITSGTYDTTEDQEKKKERYGFTSYYKGNTQNTKSQTQKEIAELNGIWLIITMMVTTTTTTSL